MSDEDDDSEARRANTMRDPIKPTQKEVDAHNVTHMPFRNWCPHCVTGSAPNRRHEQGKQEGYQIPPLMCDYCFLGDKSDGETLVVQVTKDATSKCVFSHAVPRKGMSHEHGVEHLCKDIEALGYKEVVINTDNEPAMRTLH